MFGRIPQKKINSGVVCACCFYFLWLCFSPRFAAWSHDHRAFPACISTHSATTYLLLLSASLLAVRFSLIPAVLVSLWHLSCSCFSEPLLRIEARANTRTESPKIRNRRRRLKFNGSPTKPRLSVFCSGKQLYAMLIDDQNKKTLFYASTLQKSIRQDPPCTTIEAAQKVGEELIKACKELNISEISSYDRNGFAKGERMAAFEIAISEHGFLPH